MACLVTCLATWLVACLVIWNSEGRLGPTALDNAGFIPPRWGLMPLYQVIVLALVQGFTEFLPVSSTAHLFLTSWLLGWQAEALDFDIALHIGTLLAVIVYFF